jgi:hypothetical protein
MKLKWIAMLLLFVMGCCLIAGGASSKVQTLVAGGTELRTGNWIPGRGNIESGGTIRGWQAGFQDDLIGPAGEFASGSGPVTMNCNLDASMTGPCWGTFEFSNSNGTWEGTWEGRFNFATLAGSYKAVGHGKGGLRGLTLHNDVVFPGVAVSGLAGTGYIYSTVTNAHGF